MAPKPGIMTTEFWLTIIGAVGATAAAAAGVLPPKYAAALMTLSAIAYKLSRGLAKITPPSQTGTPAVVYPVEPPGIGGTEPPPA